VTRFALHLLQNTVVYVNTLMIQQVLSGAEWVKQMPAEDWRGLTPLIYSHLTPYGMYRLDLQERLNLAA
jgi:hypothetical protein